MFDGEWRFNILDVVAVLAETPIPKTYWAKMKKDYEILTAEISKASFRLTPSQYKKIKGLKRENLRDHMDDLN